MKIYIRSIAAVSPLPAWGEGPLSMGPVAPVRNALRAVEPPYADLIDAKLIRRMSRMVKMGVAAAARCLQEAGEKEPGAIITGTAYGCLEDTGVFLGQLIRQQEEMLSPTAFIQSTHNTVGAQIALMLQCTNYNNTFVHRGFSFESALLDALMLLREGSAATVLAGGLDEITDTSLSILQRFGPLKHTLAGEGAAFFLLSGHSSGNDYAQLESLSTFYKPASAADIEDHIHRFLAEKSLTLEDVDLVMTGASGTTAAKREMDPLQKGIFKRKDSIGFKHLSGEYPTASSFALWLAARLLKTGEEPAAGMLPPKRILIYNQYLGIHYSLMLLSKP